MTGWEEAALELLGAYESMRQSQKNLQEAASAVSIAGPYGSDRRLDGLARRRQLQARAACRRVVRQVERGLAVLTPAQRLVVEMLCVRPDKGNVERLCDLLGCEKSTVYRCRREALKQFGMAVWGTAIEERGGSRLPRAAKPPAQ